MTITLKQTGSADIVLCHGGDDAGTAEKFVGPLGDGSTDVEWEVILRKYIGVAAAKPHPLGNAVYTFTFGVFVFFATEALATAFRLAWAATLYHDGATLEVSGDGDTVSYDPAAIKSCRVAQFGVGCQVDYVFSCGAPVAVEEEE